MWFVIRGCHEVAISRLCRLAMNYFTIYESIFEPIDNGAQGSIRRASTTFGFSKTMKDVRFGDLAEPVGDAVRRCLRL